MEYENQYLQSVQFSNSLKNIYQIFTSDFQDLLRIGNIKKYPLGLMAAPLIDKEAYYFHYLDIFEN